ncbi:MAG: ribonuclease HII [Ignavibacteria bacterium]|nr:ribonuclease HII [Ignavibacteria bacterium]
MSDIEISHWNNSGLIVGVDEAGRGALAGPVVAAAVVLNPTDLPTGIADSKVLTADVRTELSLIIKSRAIAWSVGFVDNTRIDQINILQATFDAMHASVNDIVNIFTNNRASTNGLHLLIDGNRFRPHRIPHTCIVGGDAKCISIGAASILAKTERDLWMTDVADVAWPEYSFRKHKGYATAFHRSAISKYGPCEIHRITFLSRIRMTSLFDGLK